MKRWIKRILGIAALEEENRQLLLELRLADYRLLNAFQLVKNGKQIGFLKFYDFKKLMDEYHDNEGNIK